MAEFTLGARASCSDGFCGVVSRTILDPAARTVTHLVIGPRHGGGGRLVPLDLVEATTGEIRLRCTLDEFGLLDPAEETELVDGGYGGGYSDFGGIGAGGSVSGMSIGTGLDYNTPLVVEHAVPLGEIEVERHESVHAVDGHIGHVEGFVVDPANQKVTHVLLKEGHLWGRRQVAIPVSAVASVDAGIRLNITKQQVEDLPPVDPASLP
ncbi:MAG: PRC-barrel domain-containing protein [Streptosporangiaceae bacterium]